MFEKSAKMNQQYTKMQNQLMDEINSLNKDLNFQKRELEAKENLIEQMKEEFKNLNAQQENEINALKIKKIEMGKEFSKMLRETLGKMKDRIEISQWESLSKMYENGNE